jgi:hypothetical protein
MINFFFTAKGFIRKGTLTGRVAGCRIQVSGFKLQGAGLKFQVSGSFGLQVSGCKLLQVSGFRLQGEAKSKNLSTSRVLLEDEINEPGNSSMICQAQIPN